MEGKSLYRPILARAWEITKKFKGLWFFGFFAAIISSGGEYEIIARALYTPGNSDLLSTTISGFQEGLKEGLVNSNAGLWKNIVSALFSNSSTIIVALAIFILVIAIVLFLLWLSTVSQIGLIRNISLINKTKKTTLSEGLDAGVRLFWPVFLINVVFKIIIFVMLFLMGRELLLLAGKGGLAIALYFLSFILFVIVTLIVSFLIRYQLFYLVLKKQPWLEALKSGWKLFLKNWLISLEMAFLMFIFYIVIFFVSIFIVAVLTAIPTVVLLAYLSYLPVFAKSIIALVCIVLILITMIASTILINTFQWAAWTLLFDRLALTEELSKIIRLTRQLTFNRTASGK
jgi:hypothetical protein